MPQSLLINSTKCANGHLGYHISSGHTDAYWYLSILDLVIIMTLKTFQIIIEHFWQAWPWKDIKGQIKGHNIKWHIYFFINSPSWPYVYTQTLGQYMTKFDIKGQTKCHIRKVIYDLYMTSELYVYHKPFGKLLILLSDFIWSSKIQTIVNKYPEHTYFWSAKIQTFWKLSHQC